MSWRIAPTFPLLHDRCRAWNYGLVKALGRALPDALKASLSHISLFIYFTGREQNKDNHTICVFFPIYHSSFILWTVGKYTSTLEGNRA